MFAHDSLFGGLNLFKRTSYLSILPKGERPPYPVINECPTMMHVVNNLNQADLGIMLLTTFIGVPVAHRILSRGFQDHHLKRVLFNSTFMYILAMGMTFGCLNSLYRLQGLTNNGLSWKYAEGKLRKYDFTSSYEAQTIWKYFRAQQ